MKKLIVLLTFLTNCLFGQDNPMFDSLDYFNRYKIKNVHYYLSNWYYSPGWKYLKCSFDKTTCTFKNDTIVYDDPSLPMAKINRKLGARTLLLKDTIFHGLGNNYSTTRIYQFDSKDRLTKLFEITVHDKSVNVVALSASNKTDTTTTEYFYADTSSKKLERTTTDSRHYHTDRLFYYDKKRLIKRVDTNIEKRNNDVSVNTYFYEYYVDGKLKKEIRHVKDSRCTNNCKGTIKYKYDTD